ncbi:stage II sporulation protein R [Marinicrinis sediminis]|uniref:Stage II sporulation protein R n=1 Tax=Marinicrinis sediminis TaxID=1652465 RepID=A0ABW5RAQ0_9BACL
MLKRGCTVPFLVLFICFFLLVSWEYDRANMALAESLIPDESIRLRILAHSDSVQDQWLKAKVRDEIVAAMEEWVQAPDGIHEARQAVQQQLPTLQKQVEALLTRYGIEQEVQMELGKVPFPTKMYGGQVYPAGDYEALRVTLGAGQGKNWWCVLFPPLCFVDGETGEAVAQADSAAEQAVPSSGGDGQDEGETEVKFFLLELLMMLLDWLKGLFGASVTS